DISALVEADGQSAGDVAQCDIGNGRVQHFHERRDRNDESDQIGVVSARRGTFRRPAAGCTLRELRHRTFVQGTTDMPGPIATLGGHSSTTILTGTRCTTLTKLPVAFSAGNKLKAVPEPGCTDAT